jgi:Group II intron, maturase-specific domain
VVCKSEQQAQAALARLRELLADLGLAPKEAKTRIVELAVDGEGFDFLGFHHRMVRSQGIHGRRGVAFLARWPSDRAMQRARDRITALTVGSRLWLPVEEVVKDLNRFLRGWANYFRYGHCTVRFRKIEQHARDRLALFIGKRHQRGRGFGWSVLAYKSKNSCGLLSLNGTAIAPRAGKPWREKPNAGGERRR